jgi:tail-anchored protein insertion receptor
VTFDLCCGFNHRGILDSEISAIKTSFSRKFSVILWVMTTGAQFFIGWWYRKSAVFYLPDGWFNPLTWGFAFPSAPKGGLFTTRWTSNSFGYTGSISCGVWQMACRRVLQVGERIVKDLNCEFDDPSWRG